MKNTRLRALTESAILIALAEILSLLPFYKLPWGGSIDLAMLPIIIVGVRWGFGPGMLAATAHAILQTLMEGGIAIVEGGAPLRGGVVRSTDLRAGAALMLAGFIARGETVLNDPAGHIERGYQDLPEKLRTLGADIEQVEDLVGV